MSWRAALLAIPGAALVVAVGTTAPAVRPTSAPHQDTAGPVVPFAPGERMTYDVKFGMFRVGRASMEVVGFDTVRGEPVYHVLFAVRGRAVFYSLSDTLQSWFTVRDISSRRFIQDNEENGRQRYNRYEIHPDRGFYVQNGRDTSATPSDPLDDASFFYFARTLRLDVGQTYSFRRYFKTDRNPVTLRVLGRDTIDVPAGRFAVVAVRPTFKSRGLFAEGGQATIWLSDDDARIPVAIRTRLSIGSLSINLRTVTQP